ncbi:MAG: LacI family transcriptional regulator [Atopobiaceae bacterium]|jgi:LacI family transcriptional regulator|nr:LacI family transcriptional regulator [Atopobiaceae bacterium]MCI2173538.1 LacI family transcriptional regulator [Atopobiaceae bacterium]MCI2207820.1 LacI family transcriptional regulator [Atopobiaceae bacterium]
MSRKGTHMQGKVTLKDIAEESGLSIASVSLVLNDRPCRLSDESKERIREVARKRHYVPNQIARSLVTQRSRTLGLIVPNIESRFFSSFAKSLEECARKAGYALFITNTNDQIQADLRNMQLLVERGIDGLILIVSSVNYDKTELKKAIADLSVPYVMVDRVFPDLDCDKVLFDSEAGAYLATSHLIEQGHTRVAAVVNTKGSNTGRLRRDGYERAMNEHGCKIRPEYVIEADYHIPSGYEAASKIVTTDATAIFASSDNIALGIRKYLYEHDLRVPDDYSMVSFDNSAADALFEPQLTTIEQSVDVLAESAFDLLKARLDGGEGTPTEKVLVPELVEKGSVRDIR